jgi:hypothetical protein
VVLRAAPIVYRVDAADRIEDVNDEWSRFALENDAPALASEVIGKSLWDYITGRDVRRVYASLFHRARSLSQSVSVPFRCDSPSLCRVMRLDIVPQTMGQLEFRSVLISLSTHPNRLDFLERRPRAPTPDKLQICSWCKAVLMGMAWKPLESAVGDLGLLSHELLPSFVHTVCGACLTSVRRCFACGNNLPAAESCNLSRVALANGETRRRLQHGGDAECWGCGVRPQGVHHFYCPAELCPACNGRLIDCGCL